MTGLIRKATLLTLCGLFVAGAAMAGVPSTIYVNHNCGFYNSVQVGLPCPPPDSRTGAWMAPYGSVTGPGARVTAGSEPDQYFEFKITALDGGLNPLPGIPVSIWFEESPANRCHGFSMGGPLDQPFITNNGGTVTCTGHVVTMTTAAAPAAEFGKATFRIIAGGVDVGGHPGPGLPVGGPGAGGPNASTLGCGIVKTGATLLGRIRVTTPDQDNSSSGGGVSGQDQTIVIDMVAYCNQFGGPYYIERADIDQDGDVDGNDTSREVDLVAVMNSPAHSGNNGKTCAEVPHTCCGLDPLLP